MEGHAAEPHPHCLDTVRIWTIQVWDAFDAEGVFVGHVRLPVGVGLVQVSGPSVVMIVLDEMDCATVAIHDVRWIG